MASAMSATWNSSKQMRRWRRAVRWATAGERILGAAQLVELAMDLAHEVMEVDAALAH